MKIRKDDQVKILLGKDRNKTGKVLSVFPKEKKILVEGINVYKRHLKKMGKREGGIIDITKTIDISNAALVCPHCKKASRVGFKISDGVKVRICRRCQETIDKSKGAK